MKRKPNKTTMQDSKGNDFKVGDTLTSQQYNIWPHVDGGATKYLCVSINSQRGIFEVRNETINLTQTKINKSDLEAI